MPTDIEGIIGAPDALSMARALVRHLSRPLRRIGAGELQSPEEDVVDHARSTGLDEDQRGRLAGAVTLILNGANYEIASGAPSRDLPALVGRLGFLSTSLGLAVYGRLYSSVARSLQTMARAGWEIEDAPLFLVLRAVGSLCTDRGALLETATLWLDLLRHGHRGIRTLAAQNLVRMGSSRQVAGYFAALLSMDPNVALVAREWLKVAGSAGRLAEDVGGLDPRTFSALVGGLAEVGETEAVRTLRDTGPSTEGCAMPLADGFPWCRPPDGPAPRRPTVGGGEPHNGPILARPFRPLAQGASEEVVVVGRFFRNAGSTPDPMLVMRLVGQRHVGRLHLTGA